jgi:hypothetical protein
MLCHHGILMDHGEKYSVFSHSTLETDTFTHNFRPRCAIANLSTSTKETRLLLSSDIDFA